MSRRTFLKNHLDLNSFIQKSPRYAPFSFFDDFLPDGFLHISSSLFFSCCSGASLATIWQQLTWSGLFDDSKSRRYAPFSFSFRFLLSCLFALVLHWLAFGSNRWDQAPSSWIPWFLCACQALLIVLHFTRNCSRVALVSWFSYFCIRILTQNANSASLLVVSLSLEFLLCSLSYSRIRSLTQSAHPGDRFLIIA